jgi:hypothetical protein
MSKKFKIEGVVEWAKLTRETMDTYEAHMKKSNGAFTANLYFNDSKVMDDMIAAGVPEAQLGHATFREGNADYGSGIYIKAKRPNKGPFIDSDGNDPFGGPPAIYDYTNGPSSEPWDEDKPLGNGSKVLAIVEFWKSKNGLGLRLQELAVTEYVPFESSDDGMSLAS